METIRREDLTTESAGINPEERELSYEEGDLLDEYFGDANMNLVTSVMDIIVKDAINRGIPQEGILAFFQWNSSHYRYPGSEIVAVRSPHCSARWWVTRQVRSSLVIFGLAALKPLRS